MGVLDSLKKVADDASKLTKKGIDKVVEEGKEVKNKIVTTSNEYVDANKDKSDSAVGRAFYIAADVVTDGAKQVGKGAVKMGRAASGYEAYVDRKKAHSAKEEADAIRKEVEIKNNKKKEECNAALQSYGESKLHALKTCVRPFLNYLEILGNKYKDKLYDVQGSVHIDKAEIKELKSVELNAASAAEMAAASGAAATIALTGVPTAVTSAVGALATASTGTAISSLSGAAAQNAILAWLGGGSIASGGGGMALGATVLSGITAAATGVFALAAAGTIASVYFSKKYTEATKYLEDTKKMRAEAELGWQVIDGVIKRAKELETVTIGLEKRMNELLQYLEPLVYDFQAKDDYYAETFQNTALCAKAMSELAQVPLLDESGNVNGQTTVILDKTHSILNRDL